LFGNKPVTACSHLDSVNFTLVWLHVANKISVNDLASWWNLQRFHEEQSVVTTDLLLWFATLTNSSAESANFIGKEFHPYVLVLACQECVIGSGQPVMRSKSLLETVASCCILFVSVYDIVAWGVMEGSNLELGLG